jgi:1,2-diacylglycerol 3-alpha-glucosyltransferase
MTRVAIIHNIPIDYKHLLFSALVRKGVDFEAVFLASGSRDRIESPDLSIAPYRSRVGFQGRYEVLPTWQTVRYVWRSLNEIQPGIVIISGWADAGAWAAKLWCAFHHRLSILWAESNRCDRPRRYWRETIKTMFLRGFNAAQVYGTTNAQYLIELGFDPSRIWTKRAVADVNLFRLTDPAGTRQRSRKVILFVGRLAREKNLEFVLDSISMLSANARQSLLLRFVGYGPLERALRLKAERLKLNDMVEFPGPRKHSQLPDVYHAADAILLASTSEAWGLTINEGMLCGLPAIVSDRCGCTSDLVNSRTGWSFDPCDTAQFVRILENIAAMPFDEVRAMGRNAAALAQEYSPENCARIVMNCLAATLSGSRPTA